VKYLCKKYQPKKTYITCQRTIMKIELIGFDFAVNSNHKLDIFKEVVNNSDSDLILFPGHTLRDEEDIHYLYMHIENTKPTIVFELEEADPTSCMHTRNELYIFRNGDFEDLYTSQIFATADDINGNESLIRKFFDELPRRSFTCCGKRITVLQCGETALLSSQKKDNYKSGFRFAYNEELNQRYLDMLNSTDIFLNPIHDLQGEQGIMNQRRIALSGDNRYYMSTAALNREMCGKFESKRLQYVLHNGRELNVKPFVNSEMGYVVRTICID